MHLHPTNALNAKKYFLGSALSNNKGSSFSYSVYSSVIHKIFLEAVLSLPSFEVCYFDSHPVTLCAEVEWEDPLKKENPKLFFEQIEDLGGG